VYAAVDVGALVKCGDEVMVCTRRAAGGDDLAALRKQVLREYLAVDVREQEVRAAVWKMQGALMRQFAGLHHER
jgi:F-type H+-transporting ATPase subunit epsilon